MKSLDNYILTLLELYQLRFCLNLRVARSRALCIAYHECCLIHSCLSWSYIPLLQSTSKLGRACSTHLDGRELSGAGPLQGLHDEPGALVVLDVCAHLPDHRWVSIAVQVVILNLHAPQCTAQLTPACQEDDALADVAVIVTDELSIHIWQSEAC